MNGSLKMANKEGCINLYIKIAVDNSDRKGQYWLTGSQQFHKMKNVIKIP